MIACCGLDELWKTLAVLSPVEITTVDDDTGDGGTVAADPFSSRGDDDVGSYFVLDI